MNVGSLFSGAGLLDYGLHLAGFDHAWLCEADPWRRELLATRFPGVPIYDDVRAVGADAEPVELIAGGFPCKGVSQAGRRQGFGHPETALWREMLRVVRQLRPRYVLVENVATLLSEHRGELFGEVVGGLAESGFDIDWDCLPAAAFGGAHRRDRVFITATAVADSKGLERTRLQGPATHGPDTDAERLGRSSRSGFRPPEPPAERRRGPAHRPSPIPADADELGRHREPALDRQDGGMDVERGNDANGRGPRVDWGRYAGAVERWEDVLGRPAPQPLIRRMDDGRPAGLDRPRLSALGDGVFVHAGWFCGRRILDHAEALK